MSFLITLAMSALSFIGHGLAPQEAHGGIFMTPQPSEAHGGIFVAQPGEAHGGIFVAQPGEAHGGIFSVKKP